MVLTYDDIEEETDLAIQLSFGTGNIWIPKSCILSIDPMVNEVEVLDWLVCEKGIEAFGLEQ